MALWREVGPAIYDNKKSYFCQNIPEKLHSCLWWTLAVVPCQRSEQGFRHQGTEGKCLWAETAELFSTPKGSLFFLHCYQPALEHLSWRRQSSHWTEYWHKYTGPENSEKAPCFPFQTCEAVALCQITPHVTRHMSMTEQKTMAEPTHDSNRAEVIPQAKSQNVCVRQMLWLGKNKESQSLTQPYPGCRNCRTGIAESAWYWT